MPICRKCSLVFPNRQVVEGESRVLNSRKFCLDCSPFGSKNRSPTNPRVSTEYRCACGQTDPKLFSPRKHRVCKRCQSTYNTLKGQNTKQKARAFLGGKCKACGFDKYPMSLDIHHPDPTKKDVNFKTMRGWSWDRVVDEISTCILLCKNCHCAHHCGIRIGI